MAKKTKSMSFKWNGSNAAIVRRLGFDQNTEVYFAEQVVRYAMPYTPYDPFAVKDKSEHIRGGAEIKPTSSGARITYPNVPYAGYQYNADDSKWKRATFGTMSGWLDYAWVVHKQEITGKVGAYRRWRSK